MKGNLLSHLKCQFNLPVWHSHEMSKSDDVPLEVIKNTFYRFPIFSKVRSERCALWRDVYILSVVYINNAIKTFKIHMDAPLFLKVNLFICGLQDMHIFITLHILPQTLLSMVFTPICISWWKIPLIYYGNCSNFVRAHIFLKRLQGDGASS